MTFWMTALSLLLGWMIQTTITKTTHAWTTSVVPSASPSPSYFSSWNHRHFLPTSFLIIHRARIKPQQLTAALSVALLDIPPSETVALADLPSLENNVQQEIETTLHEKYSFPWQSSIDPLTHHGKPFYQPFFQWQVNFMCQNLQNLRWIPTSDRSGALDLTYIDNLDRISNGSTKKRPHRMITLCFTSDEYRLIRLTLLDGGGAVQVFTSLWYPHEDIQMPVLGIDLLQFANATRHLTVVDFQPIIPSSSLEDDDHDDVLYEHLLEPIRNRYPSLQHNMSRRFYDESDGFFSKQMLLGKGNSTNYVFSELWPAYQQYVHTHTFLVQECYKKEKQSRRTDNNHRSASLSSSSSSSIPRGLQGQKRYDDYSSVRDPAHGLLVSCFGREYADDFVYDVLFPLCDRPDHTMSGL